MNTGAELRDRCAKRAPVSRVSLMDTRGNHMAKMQGAPERHPQGIP